MKVRAIYEFDADVDDFSEEFVDVKELAEDLTRREIENLLHNKEISASDFTYVIEEENHASCPFTDEELYILSDAMLALIRNTNHALKCIYDKHSIATLTATKTNYQELSQKVCSMLR